MQLAARWQVRQVVDCGAHHGAITAALRQAFPDARIQAIEADPRNQAVLTKRFADDNHVSLHAVALGDTKGTGAFHLGRFDATSSLYPRETVGRRYWRSTYDMKDTVTVDVVSLDDLARNVGLDTIDLLKLDTQGAEFAILQGARGLLSRGAIGVILTEFFLVPHYAGAPLLPDIWALLTGHGYRLYDIATGAYGANGQARYGDAIFLSPERCRLLDAMTGAEP